MSANDLAASTSTNDDSTGSTDDNDDDDDDDCDDDDDDDEDSSSSSSSSSGSTEKASSHKVQTSSDSSDSTATTSAASSTSTSTSSNGSGSLNYSGKGTYYLQGGNAGACGNYNSDSSHIVALETTMYANGAHCGKTVTIENKSTGAKMTATVADECPSCVSTESVDMSEGLFTTLATLEEGEINIVWGFT